MKQKVHLGKASDIEMHLRTILDVRAVLPTAEVAKALSACREFLGRLGVNTLLFTVQGPFSFSVHRYV